MKKYFTLFTVVFALLFITTYTQAQTQIFKVGDKAPLFSATTHNGQSFDLKKQLENSSVILLFYRGYWCPYCNKQLSQLNDSLSLIAEKGAKVIAVTPEIAESVNKTIAKTKASFDIISDTTNTILKQYAVNFTMENKAVERYKGFGIDIAKTNGNDENILPVPGVFIISKDGTFKYIYFNTDYRKRPSVKELVENL